MSVVSEISRIRQAKESIRNAIIAKGVDVPAGDLINTYAEKVSAISGGGGGESGETATFSLKSVEISESRSGGTTVTIDVTAGQVAEDTAKTFEFNIEDYASTASGEYYPGRDTQVIDPGQWVNSEIVFHGLPIVSVSADKMLSGATAINTDGEVVTGTIKTVVATNNGTTVTVPVGYIAEEQTFEVGGGTVELPEVTVSADKMLAGVTALDSNGNVITGSIQTVSLSRSGNTVSIGRGYTEGGSVTVPASGSTEAASYYACASVESGSWTGYAGSLSENVLSFPGSAVSLNYSGNAPEIGNMYLADGSMKVIPNGEYVPIPFVSLAGGASGKAFGMELAANTDNIYSEVVYTLDAPDGFSYSDDGVISGTLPGTTDTFTLTLLAEADGYISVAARVDVTPVTIASGAAFIHFPFSGSLASTTGQHLVQYSSSYNMPSLTTFDGKNCIKVGAEYVDEGEEYSAAKTLEYTGFTGSPTMTVAFFACLEKTMYDEWYYSVPDCVCFGKNKDTGKMLRFSPMVHYDDEYNETNLLVGCDCWNFAAETDTGIKNDGKMHHYAFVLSGSSLAIYFDGNLLETATLSGTVNLNNSSMYIGKAGGGGYEQFYGYISDIKIWDRALSAAEISALQ